MGAHGDHISAHHADDHKSGDIGVQEFGWYLADCAGLADYRDGSLDGYTPEMYASYMKHTIESFEHAIDHIHERQKNNAHPLHMDDSHREKYQHILQGHRKQIGDLFKEIDLDGSGTLDLAELEDIIKEVEGGKFNEKDFFGFFKGKTPDDELNQTEFGWYIADQAGENDKVSEFIEKCRDVRKSVHERYRLERAEGKR